MDKRIFLCRFTIDISVPAIECENYINGNCEVDGDKCNNEEYIPKTKINDKNKDIIKSALDLAFEAGKWAGQVELEEHFDKEQYGQVAAESLFAEKISMPISSPSTGRTVTINLRSIKWREGVKKSSTEYRDKAESMLINNIIKI